MTKINGQLRYMQTGIAALDYVLGGGLVLGHLILFGGPSGVGRTRLLLQIANGFAQHHRALYANGIESRDNILAYARQLNVVNDHVEVVCNIGGIALSETTTRAVDTKAKLLIVDCLQACALEGQRGEPGNTAQIHATIAHLHHFARNNKIATIAACNLNKEGYYAGGANNDRNEHKVDVFLRLDPYIITDNDGLEAKGTETVRVLWIDQKSRQSKASNTALIELTEHGFQPLSPRLAKLYGLPVLA